mmetsp:Transcript_8680/g.24070  ORF Transcript_8680/g.24070 Transcript_8680/m.24070 type:complete len:465 (+) Transcript_8680:1298-2692(+)|eukprot:scaffold303210_cov35-Tisochrysis_lutea.AAC.2
MAIDSSHGADEKATAAFAKSLQWTPKVSLNGASNSSISAASFIFNESLAWIEQENPLPRQRTLSACENCAVYMAKENFELKFSEMQFGSYVYFPFDMHTLRIQISIQDTARFYACDQALRNSKAGWTQYDANTPSQWQQILLPSTNEWTVIGSDGGFGFVPVEESPNSCELVLLIARNPLVFLVKQILTTIFFVLCGLLALTLAPTDLMGDRVTTILFSALIVTTNMQGNIGLGSLQYILWYDIFNLTQFLILFMVLMETLYVHKLVSWQRYHVAYRLDRMMLTTITLVYVASLAVLFILPFDQHGATVLACVLVPFLVCGSLLAFWCLRRREARQRQASLLILRSTPMSEKEAFNEALRRAYASFDFDGNDTLDIDSLRRFIHAVYPKCDQKDLNEALVAAHHLFADNKTITFEGFETIFESFIVPLMGSPMEAARSRLSSSRKRRSSMFPRSGVVSEVHPQS